MIGSRAPDRGTRLAAWRSLRTFAVATLWTCAFGKGLPADWLTVAMRLCADCRAAMPTRLQTSSRTFRLALLGEVMSLAVARSG